MEARRRGCFKNRVVNIVKCYRAVKWCETWGKNTLANLQLIFEKTVSRTMQAKFRLLRSDGGWSEFESIKCGLFILRSERVTGSRRKKNRNVSRTYLWAEKMLMCSVRD